MHPKPGYQQLFERIFIGGAADAESMVSAERVDVIVDLREEAAEPAVHSPDVEWIHVPLADAKSGQELNLRKAVNEVVNAYKLGKKVALH